MLPSKHDVDVFAPTPKEWFAQHRREMRRERLSDGTRVMHNGRHDAPYVILRFGGVGVPLEDNLALHLFGTTTAHVFSKPLPTRGLLDPGRSSEGLEELYVMTAGRPILTLGGSLGGFWALAMNKFIKDPNQSFVWNTCIPDPTKSSKEFLTEMAAFLVGGARPMGQADSAALGYLLSGGTTQVAHQVVRRSRELLLEAYEGVRVDPSWVLEANALEHKHIFAMQGDNDLVLGSSHFRQLVEAVNPVFYRWFSSGHGASMQSSAFYSTLFGAIGVTSQIAHEEITSPNEQGLLAQACSSRLHATIGEHVAETRTPWITTAREAVQAWTPSLGLLRSAG